MAKKGDSVWDRVFWVVFTILMIGMLTAGGLMGYNLILRYLDGEEYRDGFTEDNLTVPLNIYDPFDHEEPPEFIMPGDEPPINCTIMRQENGTAGIGAFLNISLVNEGSSMLFVEGLEAKGDWGAVEKVKVNRYVKPGQNRHLAYINLDVPDPAPIDSDVTISIDVLVGKAAGWARREGIEFYPSGVDMYPMTWSGNEVDLHENLASVYDKVVPLIEKDLIDLVSLSRNITSGWEGGITIQNIADIFHYVQGNLKYIPDTGNDENQWSSTKETLDRKGGDCEDYAMLFSGLVTALGGTSRVVVTDIHAFSAFYIGHSDNLIESLEAILGAEVPFQVLEDDLGKWLIIEPQAALVMGWFPVGVVPVRTPIDGLYIHGRDDVGWGFLDTENVYIVDIYFD